MLKFCPGSNSGQLEQGKKNKKSLYVDSTGLSNRNDNLGVVRVPGGQWVGVEGFNVVRLTILGFLIRSA